MSIHRDPTEEEKVKIKNQHTSDGKIRCFVDNHPIDNEADIEYHHIKPFSRTGPTEAQNLAPVCKDHHFRIRTLSITEYRDRLRMEEFFKFPTPRKLSDVLTDRIGLNNYAKDFKYEIKDSKIKVYLANILEPIEITLSSCPSTEYKYFYIDLPVEYLNNDEKLQPRPLEIKRLWELYRHLIVNTQLSASIGRLNGNKILLFDGQHKAAAQIWAGRKSIECKIYINPDIKILKETNLTAHDKLRQMPFFTSVLINKWADIYKEEWQDYLETSGQKSEAAFVAFLIEKGKNKTQAINMILSNIYESIIEDESNQVNEYISDRNRTRKNPLSINALKLTIFKKFIAYPPLNINLEDLDELREYERQNLITLLNILTEETLINRWAPERNDNPHKLAERIYSAGSLKAWSSILKDVIAQVLNLYDGNDRNKIFLREVKDDKWNDIRGRIKKLFEHKIWVDLSPEVMFNLRVNNEEQVRKYFTDKELTVNWVLGGIGA